MRLHRNFITTYVPAEHRQNTGYIFLVKYEGWNFNSGNYLFTTDTK